MIVNILRRVSTRVSLVAAVATGSLVAGAGTASATPADWPKADPVSGLDFVLLLVVFPLCVIAVVGFLAWFPSLVKAGKETTTEVATRPAGD